MRHLAVVESQEPQATESYFDPAEKEQLLKSFEVVFDDLKTCSHARTNTIDTEEYSKGIATVFSGLANGEARHLRIKDKVSGESEKEILILKRQQDDESILTLFAIQRDSEGVHSAAVFQEVENKVTQFKDQLDIRCDAGVMGEYFATILHTSQIKGEHALDQADPSDKKHLQACLKSLDTAAHKALDPSVDRVVSHSETDEKKRIRLSKRKKGMAKAIIATIHHLPQHVYQERQAAA